MKCSWSYLAQQCMVLCLILESSCTLDLRQLCENLYKCSSYLARLINTPWVAFPVRVVNSSFWSLGWIWRWVSVWPWCLRENTYVRSNSVSCSAVAGAVGGPSWRCACWPEGHSPGLSSALTFPHWYLAISPVELCCWIALWACGGPLGSASREMEEMACFKSFCFVHICVKIV